LRIYHCLSETQASCLIDYFHLLQIKLWRVSLINSASVNNIVSTVLHTLPPYFHCSTVGLTMSILMFWFMHSIFITLQHRILIAWSFVFHVVWENLTNYPHFHLPQLILSLLNYISVILGTSPVQFSMGYTCYV
jgi:hypothetical protein